MEFFQRAWATTQVQLNKLPASSKWLIGSLLVILLMVGFLAVEYAGRPEMVSLVSGAGDRAPAILARLQTSGIKAQTQGGQIMVSADKRDEAYAALAEGELLSGSTAAAFDDMIKGQTPWTTHDQNAQHFLLAKQKVLGQIIAKMVGVQSADVMLATPEDKGFGATYRRPSASVNVMMRESSSVNRKKLFESIAGLVAGSVAEMRPEDVVVIDARQGRQFTVKKQDGLSSDAIESLQSLEQYYRDKVAEALIYIPGVIVAVNVHADPVVMKDETITKYGAEPLRSEQTDESESREAGSGGAEAGVRPNTGLAIDTAGGGGGMTKTSKSRTDYADTKVVGQTVQRSAGGLPKQINVTVNVPRSFFVEIFKQGKAAGSPEPDEAAIEAIKAAQLAQIEAQIKPLISTNDSAGAVAVHMIPDARGFAAGVGGPGGSTAAAPGVFTLLDSGWIKPAGLSLLALVSLGLMFGMVRKATQQAPMPTVQELAGVPASLPIDEDLIGDAEATEATMAGVELGEDEIRTRKIAEQIADMVKTSPAEAAGLFNRWVRKEG